MSIYVLAFVCVTVVIGITPETQQDPFSALGKIEGRWNMKTKNGIIVEAWKKLNANEFSGESYKVIGSDTTLLESIRLVAKEGHVDYIPVASGQNDGKTITFRLVEFDQDRFVFENKGHDFPKRIIYKFVSNDSIVARVEDDSKGSNYHYSRSR